MRPSPRRLGMVGLSAVLLVSALVSGCTSTPPYDPTQLHHLGTARQVVVAVGDSPTSSYGTVHAYEKGTDGVWREAFAPMSARFGYSGWRWAASRVQGDGSSPAGTFTLTTAFGLQANPGTRLPYQRSDANDYWSGDPRDPKTYNLYQTSASAARTWRVSSATSEHIADYPTQYAYSVVVNFDRPPDSSIAYDAARGQFETSQPVVPGHGTGIFLHVKGAGSTAGCVSVDSADLVGIMRWLDPAKSPRIVMAPTGWLAQA